MFNSVNAAIVLCELCQRFIYHSSREELITINETQDWFYHTIDAMEDRLGITRKEQDHAISILKHFGVIATIVKGVPPRRFFLLLPERIAELVHNSNNLYNLSK